tara:strand:+ start:247 stop:1194 length:948 start_codon:yes stop_codon:yes gene_type:complete
MPLLTRKRVILIEAEASYGSDPTIVSADAVLVRDLNITPQSSDIVSREVVRPFLGAFEQLQANTNVEVSFSVEFAGSGTEGTPPRYADAIKACGFAEAITDSDSSGGNDTVTYTPVSTAFPSITIHYNTDGVRHIVTGCRGSFVINGSVGEIPTIDFTFTGIYNAPTDTAIPTVSYGDQATPLIFKAGNTSGFQLLSHSGVLSTISLDIGNELIYRELVGGTKETLLVNRNISGSVQVEATALSTKDYFAAALGNTSGNLVFTHGTAAGNKVQISSSKADIGDVAYSDMDGIQMLDIPYTLVPTTENDELSIIYT